MRVDIERVRRSRFGIAAVLLIAGVLVFHRVGGYPFINFDDPKYVTGNPVVGAGLTPEGVRWAFTTTHASNWHPVTWLSHMLDVSLFGMDAGRHHLVNVLFHLLNALALFFVLAGMTGALWRSAAVAALFAFHPLHVESVAWVAERKDVLSGFFFLLTLWAYGRYASLRGPWRYLAVVVFMALGLMSKPMLVTLPFVLLLLDFWPLGRWGGADRGADAPPSRQTASLPLLLLEKVPLLALSAASCAVTWLAQHGGGAMGRLPLWVRAGNAAIGYATYVGKTVWPASLSVFYPHPRYSVSPWESAGAGLLLAAATVAALAGARRRPYLAVGWLWFLGMLVPVIGLVQVGNQAMADRYTYLPLIGLFIAAAWGAAELARKMRVPDKAAAAAAGLCLSALAVCTWFQVGYWRGPVPLFTHALEATGDNWVAQHFLGEEALAAGRYDEAIERFGATLRLVPFSFESRNNLGVALMERGRLDEAISVFGGTLRMDPMDVYARLNLGLALGRKGRLDEAAERFREVLVMDPGNGEAARQLGLIRMLKGG